MKENTAPEKSVRKPSLDADKLNEGMVKDMALERANSEMNLHNSKTFRNSFIIEEDEDEANEHLESRLNERDQSPPKKLADISLTDLDSKSFDLPFAELCYINLADNQVYRTLIYFCLQVFKFTRVNKD